MASSNSQPLYSDEEEFLAFDAEENLDSESGSDIDELEPPLLLLNSDDEDMGPGAGGRGPWIPVMDLEEYEPRPLGVQQ